METSEPNAAIIETIRSRLPDVQAIYLYGTHGTEYERPDSDMDIAVLLPRGPARSNTDAWLDLQAELERLLGKRVDLVDIRRASTVLQKEVLAADRCIYVADQFAMEEFEMIALSDYQRLNEERAAILDDARKGGRFYDV